MFDENSEHRLALRMSPNPLEISAAVRKEKVRQSCDRAGLRRSTSYEVYVNEFLRICTGENTMCAWINDINLIVYLNCCSG